MKILPFFLSGLYLLIVSCSSDEEPQMMITEPEPQIMIAELDSQITTPNVIGIYKLFSARDECPDPALNVINIASNGKICASAGCATITLTLREDSSYNYDQFFDLANGTNDKYIEDGTFSFRNDTIVTTSLDQSVIETLTVVLDGKFLDFLNLIDNEGCKQFWRYGKQ